MPNELDLMIAEKVMGVSMPSRDEAPKKHWSISTHKSDVWYWDYRESLDGTWQPMPFSSSVESAYQVVEKMRERFTNVSIHGANGWGVSFGEIREINSTSDDLSGFTETWTPIVNAETLPTAICRAALKAVSTEGGK